MGVRKMGTILLGFSVLNASGHRQLTSTHLPVNLSLVFIYKYLIENQAQNLHFYYYKHTEFTYEKTSII